MLPTSPSCIACRSAALWVFPSLSDSVGTESFYGVLTFSSWAMPHIFVPASPGVELDGNGLIASKWNQRGTQAETKRTVLLWESFVWNIWQWYLFCVWKLIHCQLLQNKATRGSWKTWLSCSELLSVTFESWQKSIVTSSSLVLREDITRNCKVGWMVFRMQKQSISKKGFLLWYWWHLLCFGLLFFGLCPLIYFFQTSSLGIFSPSHLQNK